MIECGKFQMTTPADQIIEPAPRELPTTVKLEIALRPSLTVEELSQLQLLAREQGVQPESLILSAIRSILPAA
jgi:hypothetical protein